MKSLNVDSFIEKNPNLYSVFSNHFPKYLVNEIDPIFQKLNYHECEDLVVFDIGGNHGLWSAAFVFAFGSKTKRIEIFEPMPGNIKAIKTNLKRGLFGAHAEKINVNPHGISSKNKMVEIYFDREVSALASMSTRETHLPARSVTLENSLEVEVKTIASVCREKKIQHIDIMKVDIEGFELFAYKGAKNLFDKGNVKATLFEFGPHQLAHRHNFRDFFEFFNERNYSIFQFRPMGGALLEIKHYHSRFEMFHMVTMFLAVHNG